MTSGEKIKNVTSNAKKWALGHFIEKHFIDRTFHVAIIEANSKLHY